MVYQLHQFHKHDTQVVLDEIVKWATEGVAQLGCSPCTLAVGVGRSHFEAAAMMLQAQTDGRYDVQSEMEQEQSHSVHSQCVALCRSMLQVKAELMNIYPNFKVKNDKFIFQ